MLKKIISTVILLLLVFLTVSCGKNDEISFVRGTVNNNVYTSSFSGLKFSPGPSWSFSSDKDILSQNGIYDDGMTEEEIADKLNELETVYDMIAENASPAIKVVILYEKTSSGVIDNDISIDEYVNKLKSDLIAKYADTSASVSTGNAEKIGGLDFACVEVLLTREGSDVKQVYYVRNISGYVMSVCVTSPADTDISNEVLSMFDPIKNEG